MKPRKVVSGQRLAYQRQQSRVSRTQRSPGLTKFADQHRRSLLLIVAALGLVFLWWQWFGIAEITISGNQLVTTSHIHELMTASFGRHPTWRNLMMIDTAAMAQEIIGSQHQLSAIKIVRHWPRGLDVRVNERVPIIIWKSGVSSYWVDSEGVVMGQAVGDATISVPTVTDTSSLPVKVGDSIVSSRFVSFVRDIVEQLPKLGVGISSISVPDSTTDLYVVTTNGYQIKFETTRKSGDELLAVSYALADAAAKKKPIISHIDVRIEGKDYYQ